MCLLTVVIVRGSECFKRLSSCFLSKVYLDAYSVIFCNFYAALYYFKNNCQLTKVELCESATVEVVQCFTVLWWILSVRYTLWSFCYTKLYSYLTSLILEGDKNFTNVSKFVVICLSEMHVFFIYFLRLSHYLNLLFNFHFLRMFIPW